jgi:hypothetical protein
LICQYGVNGALTFHNTRQEWQNIYPYITESRIRRALANLESRGLIKSGNYNKVKYDRTKWYSLTDKGMQSVGLPPLVETTNGMIESQTTIGEIHQSVVESADDIGDNHQPIPIPCPVPVLSVPLEQVHAQEPAVDNSSNKSILGSNNPVRKCKQCNSKMSFHTNNDPSEKQERQGYWKNWYYCNTCKTKPKHGDGQWIEGSDPYKEVKAKFEYKSGVQDFSQSKQNQTKAINGKYKSPHYITPKTSEEKQELLEYIFNNYKAHRDPRINDYLADLDKQLLDAHYQKAKSMKMRFKDYIYQHEIETGISLLDHPLR